MIRTTTLSIIAGLALAGCAENSARFLIDPPAAEAPVRVRVSTVELRDVSLPSYAAALEIAQQEAGGGLRNLPDSLWADDPVRGVTVALARALAAGTTATVAAEPWPLAEPAQAQVSVRVERMLSTVDGQFQLRGQYAVASPDGVIRERLEAFDINVPVAAAEPGAIATANGVALGELARQIARTLAR